MIRPNPTTGSTAGRAVRALVLAATLAAVGAMQIGCGTPKRLRSVKRYERGLVLVLPGIEGRSKLNRDIVIGLDQGGVTSAIEVFDWTLGVPGVFLANLALYERNRGQAERLAERILQYRHEHPGRPVHLVGHSGGGGMILLGLEALPPGRQIDMALLLGPAISPDYDLTTALRRTSGGIVNFYSEKDIGFLTVGTSVFGSIDRDYGPSAGAIGFTQPEPDGRADRQLYKSKLRQVRWTSALRRYGASGTHLGWTSRKFVRSYLAPIVVDSESRRPIDAGPGSMVGGTEDTVTEAADRH